jgi:hypothetical protein
MTLNETIEALQKLAQTHGGTRDVTVWQYGGGLDDLRHIAPTWDADTWTVVIEAGVEHESGARR